MPTHVPFSVILMTLTRKMEGDINETPKGTSLHENTHFLVVSIK